MEGCTGAARCNTVTSDEYTPTGGGGWNDREGRAMAVVPAKPHWTTVAALVKRFSMS